MVRSTEINAAHTYNHEAKDLSSGRRSEFLLATYSKYCLLEVSRVPDIRSSRFGSVKSALESYIWIDANQRNPQAY